MLELDPFILPRMLALRHFSVFAGAELGELAMLAENVVEGTFARGAVVAAAGARPPALQMIVDGQIAMTGRTWGPREVFGTLEVLARRDLTAPAIAVVDTRTLQLFASDITDVLEESTSALRAMVRDLAGQMATHHPLARTPTLVSVTAPLGFVERLIVLRQLVPFASARLEAVATLAQASEEVRFPAGAIVARAGDRATAAFIVVDGRLRGGESLLGPGDAIGALEALAELGHPLTIVATTAVRALKSTTKAIFDVLEDHADFGMAMISSFAALLLDGR
jgi:CRP-like cAMP-binding protein